MTDHKELRRLAAAAERFAAPWEHIHGGIWCPSEKGGQTKFIDIRGWGYLTGGGHGALGLPSEEAAAIQDALGDYVAACTPKAVTALLDELAECQKAHEEKNAVLERDSDEMEVMEAKLEKAEAEREQLIQRMGKMNAAVQAAVNALHEAEAILDGEYGDTFGPMCEMMNTLRTTLEALATPHPAATITEGVSDIDDPSNPNVPEHRRLRLVEAPPATPIERRTPGTVEVCEFCRTAAPEFLGCQAHIPSFAANCPIRPKQET